MKELQPQGNFFGVRVIGSNLKECLLSNLLPLTLPQAFVANLFFLTVLFPYVSPIKVPFDVQPYAAFCATMILFVHFHSDRLRLPSLFWLLSVPLLYASFLFSFYEISTLAALRSIAGYVSIFAVAAATYLSARYFRIKVFIVAVWVWAVVAIIQTFIWNGFGFWIVPRFAPTNYYRGVTSLATEPSHYATVCFFFILLNEVFFEYGLYPKRRYAVLLALLFFQIILSLSGLGLLFILAFWLFKLISLLLKHSFRWVIKRAVAGFLLVSVMILIILEGGFLSSTRGFGLLNLLIRNPASVMQDASVGGRANDILLAFSGSYRSYGIGWGVGTWGYSADVFSSGGRSSLSLVPGGTARLMSGWGTAFYELGIFGLILAFLVSCIMLRGIMRDQNHRWLYLLILLSTHLAMTNAVPLAFPLFPFLVGICATFLWRPIALWPAPILR